MIKKALAVVFLLAALLTTQAQTPQGKITVAWNPVSDKPGATIAGYNVCTGPSATQLGSCDPVGKITETVLGGLTDCTVYFIGVKARDTDGDLSTNWSNIISGWPDPRMVSIIPATGQVGRPTAITITGANFTSGSQLTMTGGIVTNVTVGNCNTLTATVTPNAVGSPVFSITSSGVTRTASGLFQVTDVIRPDDVSGTIRK